jgi:hypothetical protein
MLMVAVVAVTAPVVAVESLATSDCDYQQQQYIVQDAISDQVHSSTGTLLFC